MTNEIVKVHIESGYFWLSPGQNHYPHRRACWANRLFLTGPMGTNWSSELLKFREFVKFSQNYFTQISKMIYWKRALPLPDVREREINWGPSISLWDTGRVLWPRNPTQNIAPYKDWQGAAYRGTGYGSYPQPPSISYRYVRNCGLSGRKQFGYLRCIETQFLNYGAAYWGERLPFVVHPARLAALHSTQITEPLSRSGMQAWHNSANAIREVVISHREGQTSVLFVSGYAPGAIITTSRNFALPVL